MYMQAAALHSQSWLNSGGPIGGYCPASGYNVTDVRGARGANAAPLASGRGAAWGVCKRRAQPQPQRARPGWEGVGEGGRGVRLSGDAV